MSGTCVWVSELKEKRIHMDRVNPVSLKPTNSGLVATLKNGRRVFALSLLSRHDSARPLLWDPPQTPATQHASSARPRPIICLVLKLRNSEVSLHLFVCLFSKEKKSEGWRSTILHVEMSTRRKRRSSKDPADAVSEDEEDEKDEEDDVHIEEDEAEDEGGGDEQTRRSRLKSRPSRRAVCRRSSRRSRWERRSSRT